MSYAVTFIALISQTVAHLVDCSMMAGCINSTSDLNSIIYDPYIINLSLLKITENETLMRLKIYIYSTTYISLSITTSYQVLAFLMLLIFHTN